MGNELINIKKLKIAIKGLYLLIEKEIADDINDRIVNVMKDYKSQVIILINKLERETKRRKEAEKLLRIYENATGNFGDMIRAHQEKYKETNDS